MVAHRGASQYRAEHTLAAYALALEQGADGLECDVRLTRDGHLVCVHDRTVNRTSTGSGVVSELTLSQLKEFNFGQWRHDLPDTADDLVRKSVDEDDTADGDLLTFEALLGLVADSPRGARLFIETKHPVRYAGLVEEKLVILLRRHGLAAPESKRESPIVVMSFSPWAVRRIREQAPKLPTVLLMRKLGVLQRAGALPRWADIAGPSIHLLRDDPDYVARCTEHGHDTYCWTVDLPADVELCRRVGVRYLATNAPASTRGLLDPGSSATVTQS
ncbi:MAG: glycerophosphodiester phosphodiesterase [Kutzneria sp.]|nr:glycerophosphodiester phosphodiesterase [Kutzneria sp.]MBV9847851.1 glycerophosphodiester phosphodiesterase [Kutzneria sp.]